MGSEYYYNLKMMRGLPWEGAIGGGWKGKEERKQPLETGEARITPECVNYEENIVHENL